MKKMIICSLLSIVCLANAEISIPEIPAEISCLSLEETNKRFEQAVCEFEQTEEFKQLEGLFNDLMEKNKGNYFAEGGDSSDPDYQAWCDAYDKYQQAQEEIGAKLDVFRLMQHLSLHADNLQNS